MDNETKTVKMTAEEQAQFEVFKQEQKRKEAEDKAKRDRETYADMVDTELTKAIKRLQTTSRIIKTVKARIIADFDTILDMKADVLKLTKNGQKSHTFTSSDGKRRVTIGRHIVDSWKDTVDDGIQMVKDSIIDYIKDDTTKALVGQIMRLLSKDKAGNLKIRSVLELDKMATELNNHKLNEGISLIKTSHIPSFTKTYIRAEYKTEAGEWENIPLGMTEV